MIKSSKNSQVYLVGGGIASLASAAYFIKDGRIPGKNIHVFEESKLIGGSLDAQGSAENGYVMRGYRMFEEKIYSCMYDLLSFIPAKNYKSAKDEMVTFNKRVKTHSQARLIEDGKIINAWPLGLSWEDRAKIFELMALTEVSLKAKQIIDFFTPAFFKTDFWLEFSTTFGFQPSHSLVELRRYFLRFIQEPPEISTLAGVRSTLFNQYDSIIVPLYSWLQKQGVNFCIESCVKKLDFAKNKKTVVSFDYVYDNKNHKIILSKSDYVLVTLGSMVANSSFGSMTRAPQLESSKPDNSWALWENIAKHHRNFGRPKVFTGHVDKSKLVSFTITFKDSAFFKLMEKLTNNKAGEQGLITFKNSNWLMSVVLPKQPHFANQPQNITVCFGYGVYPDRIGNFVSKKMSECTGEEILTELCVHLGFEKCTAKIINQAICVPCLLPYGASQFLPRKKGDRPQVVPPGATNFAFIGQYCEIPDDIVFTVEYSVRSAQIAVYSLLKLAKEVTPVYKGQYNIKILYDAFKASLR